MEMTKRKVIEVIQLSKTANRKVNDHELRLSKKDMEVEFLNNHSARLEQSLSSQFKMLQSHVMDLTRRSDAMKGQ